MGFFDSAIKEVESWFGGGEEASQQAPTAAPAPQVDPVEVERANQDVQIAQGQLKKSQDAVAQAKQRLEAAKLAREKASTAQQAALKQRDDAQHFDTTNAAACQRAEAAQAKANQALTKAKQEMEKAQKDMEAAEREIDRLTKEVDQREGDLNAMRYKLDKAKRGH